MKHKFNILRLISFIILIGISASLKAQTELFKDQFEVGDPYWWTSVPRENAIDTILDIQTEIKHSGKYAAHFFKKGNLVKAYTDTINTKDIIHFRTWFYLGEDFSLEEGYYAEFISSGRTRFGAVTRFSVKNSGGQYVLYLRPQNIEGTTELERNKWYCFEARINHCGESETTGSVTAWLNGNEDIIANSVTVFPLANEIRLGLFQRNTGSIYLDDVLVSTQLIGYLQNEITLIHPDFMGKAGVSVIAVITGDEETDVLTASLTQTGQASSQEIFSQTGNLNGRIKFPVDLTQLSSAEYTLTVESKNSSGSIKATASHTFTNSYDSNMRFSIDSEGYILKDGERFFIVSPFGLNNDFVPDWSDKYCNILYGADFDNDGPAYFSEYMDLGQEHELMTFGPMHDDRFGKGDSPNPFTLADIEDYILQNKDNQGNAFWSFREEPMFWHYYADTQKQWWDLVKQNDPSRLTHVNYMGHFYHNMHNSSLNSRMHECVYPNLVADIYGFDVYPLEYELEYSTLALACDNAYNWNFGLIPYMAFVQTTDVLLNQNGGQATPEQVKLITWLPVIHKAQGVNWFHYVGVTPPETMAVMAEFLSTITELSPVILQKDADVSVTTNAAEKGTRVDCMIKEYKGEHYLFAARVANRLTQSEPEVINVEFEIQTDEEFSEAIIYDRYDRVCEDHGMSTEESEFSFQLQQTPVDSGSVHIAGKSGNRWIYMFDDGEGNIYRNKYYKNGKGVFESGTINYQTGEIEFTFVNEYFGLPKLIPAGEENLKVHYVPVREKTSLRVTNKKFSAAFKTEDVYIFKLGFGSPTTNYDSQDSTGIIQIQNIYPNPFNSETRISYFVKEDGEYQMDIYNMQGQKIKQLFKGELIAGYHEIDWNGTNNSGGKVAAGGYIIRISGKGSSEIGKVMVIK